jgi:tetratricopeptide (TPR) repeat protein
MGQELIEKLLPALEKMTWPTEGKASLQGHSAYLIGLEKLDMYKGDPKELMAALRTFISGESAPYAFAGVANTLLVAAQEKDESYAPAGLDAAMSYLERAQETALDVTEINVTEAYVYIYNGRFEDARLVLDYLHDQDIGNFYVARAEVAFWQRQGDVAETIDWTEKAIQYADVVPKKLRLKWQLGDFYMQQGMMDEALEVYKEAIHFDRENVNIWYKISIIYYKQGNYEEAARTNQQALRIKDFPAGRKLEAALKEKMGRGHTGIFS